MTNTGLFMLKAFDVDRQEEVAQNATGVNQVHAYDEELRFNFDHEPRKEIAGEAVFSADWKSDQQILDVGPLDGEGIMSPYVNPDRALSLIHI